MFFKPIALNINKKQVILYPKGNDLRKYSDSSLNSDVYFSTLLNNHSNWNKTDLENYYKLFDPNEKGCLEKYVEDIYSKNDLSDLGEYHIDVLSKDQNEKSILLDVWIFKSIIYGGGVPNIDIKTFRNGINQVSKSTSSVIKVAQLNAPSASCCRPLDTTRLTDGEIVMLIGVEEQFRSEIKKEYNRGLGSDWFKEYISQERPKSFLVSNVSFYVD